MPFKDPIKLKAYQKEYQVKWWKLHPDTRDRREEHKLRYQNEREDRLAKAVAKRLDPVWLLKRKKYEKKHKAEPKIKVQINKHRKERMKTDINFKLACNLRSRLTKAIKHNQKAGSAIKDLGCSIQHLKLHLELFWDEGMSWNNYGEWHVDHIKSLASFDLTDRTQFLEANHYTNLQPLWEVDNLRKSNKEEL